MRQMLLHWQTTKYQFSAEQLSVQNWNHQSLNQDFSMQTKPESREEVEVYVRKSNNMQ